MKPILHALNLMIVVLASFFSTSALAQDNSEYFIFADEGRTIISLTDEGQAATELTIPSQVVRVEEGAFYGAVGLKSLYVDGANPVFEPEALAYVKDKLTLVNTGSNMSTVNILAMLNSFGDEGSSELETLEIEGYTTSDEPTGDLDDEKKDSIMNMQWVDADLPQLSTSNLSVKLPAALVGKQTLGDATFYGRFNITGELSTFCGSVTFQDTDDGSHMLFYVPTHLETSTKEIYIKRVHYIIADEGVLVHNVTGTATFADLERVDYNGQSYEANMLVGVTEPTDIYPTENKGGVDYTNFILYQACFHPTTGGTLKANRAYLQIPTNVWQDLGEAKLGMHYEKEDAENTEPEEETTSIAVATATKKAQPVVDLQTGEIMKAPIQRRGIYLIDGQKTYISK
jgi:hypothetical protein